MRAPRLSIIPAAAVTDTRLTPRALQVLCLLGRHMDDHGWLRIRQTKLAEELGCARSTIQDALELLYRSGWVEMKRQGRPGAVDPDEAKQPYASHSYRVVLDLAPVIAPKADEDDVGDRGGTEDAEPTADVPAPAGTRCPTDRHPVPTHTSAPNERSFDNEGERECARARSEKRHHVSAFLKRWPSAAVDSQEAIKREWAALPDDELQPAIDGIEQFCAELKKHKRSHLPSGATYLRERKWKGLPPPGQVPPSQKIVSFPVWSRDWWAMIFAMADRGESIKFRVDHAKERGTREVSERADRMPSAELVAGLTAVKATGEWLANWRPWFTARGVNLPFWTESVWVFLPGPFPPDQGCKALDGCLREREQDQSDEFMEVNQ